MTEVLDRGSLKALSSDTRQDIVKLLEKRPYTASELSKKLSKHVTTVSEHLLLLEKSGLIRKKDSDNKWVYYTLTNKGERIFKPAYYSWVIILSLSTLCLLIGIQQIVISPDYYAGMTEQEPLKTWGSTQEGGTEIIHNTKIMIGTVLIASAMIGFSFLIIKKLKK